MTLWTTVIFASLAVMALKLVGYLVPASWGDNPVVQRISSMVTIALLASLVIIQTFASDGGVTVDARLLSVILAGVLLAVRVPFIVVVLAAAACAAALRFWGLVP